ncbi:unnamed protein product [Owenia fusiformis]|uniref:Uncharacterized protein n=1 Tax=Owenia fusiformis TaxID=6347 RepID=A0A8J1UVW0_OWEFU|nr:unnamed protein product [Owenia fusiformis]
MVWVRKPRTYVSPGQPRLQKRLPQSQQAARLPTQPHNPVPHARRQIPKTHDYVNIRPQSYDATRQRPNPEKLPTAPKVRPNPETKDHYFEKWTRFRTKMNKGLIEMIRNPKLKKRLDNGAVPFFRVDSRTCHYALDHATQEYIEGRKVSANLPAETFVEFGIPRAKFVRNWDGWSEPKPRSPRYMTKRAESWSDRHINNLESVTKSESWSDLNSNTRYGRRSRAESTQPRILERTDWDEYGSSEDDFVSVPKEDDHIRVTQSQSFRSPYPKYGSLIREPSFDQVDLNSPPMSNSDSKDDDISNVNGAPTDFEALSFYRATGKNEFLKPKKRQAPLPPIAPPPPPLPPLPESLPPLLSPISGVKDLSDVSTTLRDRSRYTGDSLIPAFTRNNHDGSLGGKRPSIDLDSTTRFKLRSWSGGVSNSYTRDPTSSYNRTEVTGNKRDTTPMEKHHGDNTPRVSQKSLGPGDFRIRNTNPTLYMVDGDESSESDTDILY